MSCRSKNFCAAIRTRPGPNAVVSTVTYLAWVFGGTRDLEYWIIRFHVAWFPLWAILAGVAIERALATTGAFAAGAREEVAAEASRQ